MRHRSPFFYAFSFLSFQISRRFTIIFPLSFIQRDDSCKKRTETPTERISPFPTSLKCHSSKYRLFIMLLSSTMSPASSVPQSYRYVAFGLGCRCFADNEPHIACNQCNGRPDEDGERNGRSLPRKPGVLCGSSQPAGFPAHYLR